MPAVISAAELSRDADRVAILANPKSGRTDSMPRAKRLAELLNIQGFQAEFFTDLAEACRLANQWHAEGRLRALVGAGGDGTAAELVNRTAEGTPISLLPAGNSNLLARYFHLSKDPEMLCRTIAEGVAVRLDAGRANGRIFLLMASCGFDADVVQRLHSRRTGHVSDLTYFKPIAEAIWRYPFPEFQVNWEADGETASFAARWLFAFNLPCYGGGFRIAPQADGSDGLLDICGLRRGHFLSGLKYAGAILLGRHQRLSDCTMRRASRLQIRCTETKVQVPYQLDGDPGGVLPLEIETLPARLTLVVPKEAVAGGL